MKILCKIFINLLNWILVEFWEIKNDTEFFSINDIFIISELEPESISPWDDIVKSSIEGIGVIPVLFRMEADGPMIIRVLNNIEKSIRDFDITVASFEWTNAGVSARVEANAYYLEDLLSPEVTVTVRAKNGRVTKGRE